MAVNRSMMPPSAVWAAPGRAPASCGPRPCCASRKRLQAAGVLCRAGASTSSSSSSSSKAVKVDPDYEAPEVGWMWDSSSRKAAATRSSLKAANIKAKKSLGQNFCTDDAILSDIVAAAAVRPDDLVVEVGPGTGNLTRHLAATGARLVAVEKDDALFEKLRDEFEKAPNVRLVHSDVLRLDLEQLLRDMLLQPRHEEADASRGPHDGPSSTSSSSSTSGGGGGGGSVAPRRVKVVANLPYNITKDFLKALLPQGALFSELSIMIQEEVAQRLVDGEPSRPDYRAMNVFVQYYSKPVYRFRIPKEKYFPVPGVDGALVTFKLRAPGKRLEVGDERAFLRLVNQGFSERRKMLRNNLAPWHSPAQVEAALVACGLRGDTRAQDLSLQQFVQLHRQLGHPQQADG